MSPNPASVPSVSQGGGGVGGFVLDNEIVRKLFGEGLPDLEVCSGEGIDIFVNDVERFSNKHPL